MVKELKESGPDSVKDSEVECSKKIFFFHFYHYFDAILDLMEIRKSGKPTFRYCVCEDLCQFLAQHQKPNAQQFFLILKIKFFRNDTFHASQVVNSSQVLYINVIHICKKTKINVVFIFKNSSDILRLY